jgi:hypothetical protein
VSLPLEALKRAHSAAWRAGAPGKKRPTGNPNRQGATLTMTIPINGFPAEAMSEISRSLGKKKPSDHPTGGHMVPVSRYCRGYPVTRKPRPAREFSPS